MNADALLDECDWEGGGVWAFFVTVLDGVVGNEPGVTTAAFIDAVGVVPPFDIGFVDVGCTCGTSIELNVACFGQVKNVFVTVVDVAFAVDGLKMSGADGVALFGFYGDGFDPVEGILEGEGGVVPFGECENELVGKERVAWRGAYVEEE